MGARETEEREGGRGGRCNRYSVSLSQGGGDTGARGGGGGDGEGGDGPYSAARTNIVLNIS